MINANELRMGNIAYIGDKIYVLNSYDIYEIDENNSDIDPIPLTEEILLKCGFRAQPSGVFFTLKISHTSTLHWSKNTGIEIECKNYTVIGCKKDFNLHQLQNLYFALTGQELNVEL